MKRRTAVWIMLSWVFGLILGGQIFASSPAGIPVTPPAPRFTDAERQTELARRREALARAMTDKSMLILFSAEPKLYTNDVDYPFRQENDLYYLTALKQPNATLILSKNGADIRTVLFIPKRTPLFESWSGKMYSNEEAATLSGVNSIVNSTELATFLAAVRDKKTFASADGSTKTSFVPQAVYLLLPDSIGDNTGHREYRREYEFSKDLTGYKVENASIIFDDLRQIKSPYEIKLLQHAIDITTEAQ